MNEVDLAFDYQTRHAIRDYENYLDSRPANEDELAALPSHYDETVAETNNGYDEMSLPQLAREMAAADVFGDKTKYLDIEDILTARVADFINAQITNRNDDELNFNVRSFDTNGGRNQVNEEGEPVVRNSREEAIDAMLGRLAKIREAEMARLQPEVGLTESEVVDDSHDDVVDVQDDSGDFVWWEDDDDLDGSDADPETDDSSSVDDSIDTDEPEPDTDTEQPNTELNLRQEDFELYTRLFADVAREALSNGNHEEYVRAMQSLNELVNQFARENDFTPEQLQGLQDYLNQSIIGRLNLVPQPNQTNDGEVQSDNQDAPATGRFRDRLRRIRNAHPFQRLGVWANNLTNPAETDRSNRIKKMVLGGAAIAGAGLVTYWLATGKIDANPFDNDKAYGGQDWNTLDLNPFNGNRGQAPHGALFDYETYRAFDSQNVPHDTIYDILTHPTEQQNFFNFMSSGDGLTVEEKLKNLRRLVNL